MVLTTHAYLAPRLKEEYSYISTPPLGLRGLFKGEMYLYPYLYAVHGMKLECEKECYGSTPSTFLSNCCASPTHYVVPCILIQQSTYSVHRPDDRRVGSFKHYRHHYA